MLALLNGGGEESRAGEGQQPALSDVSVTEWRPHRRPRYYGGNCRHSLMLALLNGGGEESRAGEGQQPALSDVSVTEWRMPTEP